MSAGQDALDQLDERVRRLGATLSKLGWDVALHQLADELPDASQRPAHLGQLTENAATHVLNMVDAAQPLCHATDAEQLAERLLGLHSHADLGVGEARAALAEAADALRHQAGVVRGQAAVLSDVMMAQDVQGQSGQVIKKMVLIISHAGQQLRQLPSQSEGRALLAKIPGAFDKLEGPQVLANAACQEDVDGLPASMGF